ncbi:tetratricopeptide repeat protein [Lusitaniella coriacea LEGE 07157]|uniref:Tetratricopeptide repeat protein n=1 Tax=Lusitaniella coriacea LEGE 07157 TaxID=945747 RepID=A0A8J7DUY2_9CYAN|nr:tetratricopeptide repeat protein [Lusitaniella coriacea]MBE9115100.1 tetratricopeptide repeat protein [Lusitaniella coriacea LEGE 07157]
MGYSVDVNGENFKVEALEVSYEKPVFVDFFATWCGPCQLLKPLLEKLVQEYDFVLAKVDIDQNPDLARQFNIEGVPDVRIILKGEMYPGFVGAVSESQLRELLEKLNLESDLELKLEDVKSAIASKDAKRAKAIFDELFEKYPKNERITLEAAKFLLRIDKTSAAEQMLETIDIQNKEYYTQAQSIRAMIQFKQFAESSGEDELDRLFSQAAQSTLSADYERALQLFLTVLQKSRKYREDGARKAMISIFNLLGNEHPLTQQYQQELTLALY